jgi:uncharacterized protein (DUF169 family)
MSYAELADTLEKRLELRLPPIALAFVQEPPRGVPTTEAVVPSSCAFWRRAEREVFFAPAAAHFNCPLGAMVMGFPLGDAQMQQLQSDVKTMCELAYVREEEVPRVPKMARASEGIVYGPLRQFPVKADVALLWGTPQQAMVLGECCGLINWAGEPAGILGRPGCGSIPLALASGSAAQSLGCTGMRINTDVPAELILMVVPAPQIDALARNLERVCDLHAQLAARYHERAAQVARRATA